jgi:hypothetical protein
MSGGTISGNTAAAASSSALPIASGGVFNYGTFTMSGGTVGGNILSDGSGPGREVFVNGTFKMSGEARPQRVFLYSNSRSITIAGPLNGGITPIDLGIYDNSPSYINKAILNLDPAYTGGDLASLKYSFSLGNFKYILSPYTETPITGYTISDDGLFVAQ